MTVHPAAAQGFDRAAAAYERGRPSYPPAAVDLVVEKLGAAPDRVVVELGAGTGKLTRLLIPSGARIVAVEPVAGMRDVLTEAVPGVEVRDGTAEAIPVGDAEVDGVVAAQAFHWFDGAAALAEIARVLRPGGSLVVAWNVRDRSVDWVAAVDEVLDRYRGDVPTHYSGRWRDAFSRTAAFEPLEASSIPYDQVLDADGFVDRFMSVSVIASLDDAERARVERDLRSIVAGFDEPFSLPYRTAVYWCSRT